uniref:Uncharacterized protein n=1 Tax=Malassezia furfur TaxID=55194 RepID=A0A2I6QC12_MALFU|nr:hypothetical protein [Malassezia furfur]AUN27919.1 hypothetical protein [Malassezia furfur]AUN27939.1 hypothetical protein [Malassezia furfur]AUN27944.1 hypothetical protein [Malassezia furfur]
MWNITSSFARINKEFQCIIFIHYSILGEYCLFNILLFPLTPNTISIYYTLETILLLYSLCIVYISGFPWSYPSYLDHSLHLLPLSFICTLCVIYIIITLSS